MKFHLIPSLNPKAPTTMNVDMIRWDLGHFFV
jgi:hypothetical protein